jgi:hypothetical protein
MKYTEPKAKRAPAGAEIAVFLPTTTTQINHERFDFRCAKKSIIWSPFSASKRPLRCVLASANPHFTSQKQETASQMWHVPHFVKQYFVGKKTKKIRSKPRTA